jgi:hypothetical protein
MVRGVPRRHLGKSRLILLVRYFFYMSFFWCELIGSSRIAQCYNCHTTATPLWRKDDEGKTVCNA